MVINVNTDSIQTYLGLIEAIAISGGGVVYAAMENPDSFNWKSPVMWAAVFMAVIRAVKSYFAGGVKDPATAISPVVVLPKSN